MGTEQQNKVRMTAERHWERFDESSHDNAEHMRRCAEDAIEELSRREREVARIRPDLFNSMIIDIVTTVKTYGLTQQCRARLISNLSKYVVPDHPHTRPR